MTTPLTTPLATCDEDVTDALEGLAAAAEQASDDARTRTLLEVAVHRLEDAADAGLGDSRGDPLVVLQRRLGRASARLAGRSTGRVDAELLHRLARALQPEPTTGGRPDVRPATTAALAGC